MLEPASAPLALRTLWMALALMGVAWLTVLGVRLKDRDAGRTLAVRLATLAGAVVIVLVPAYLGPWPFAMVVAVIAALGSAEFAVMARAADAGISTLGTGVPAATVVAAAGVGGVTGATAAAIGGAALAVAFTALFRRLSRAPLPMADRAAAEEIHSRDVVAGLLAAAGVGYIGLLASFLVLIRMGPDGFGRLIWIVAVVQFADTFALLGGMAVGRRRLAPRLSPRKTWEGLAIGTAAAVVGGLLFAYAVPHVSPAVLAALAALTAWAALGGDLLASSWKRYAGIKDFGAALPGHGGVLDRFDSYLVAGPFVWAAFTVLAP